MKLNINHILKLCLKVLACSLIGGLVAIYILQRDPQFKQLIYQKIKPFMIANLDCEIDFKIKQVDLINGTLKVKNITCCPFNDQTKPLPWSWECQELVIKLDYYKLFLQKKICIKMEVQKLAIASDYQNQNLAILPHLKQLFFGPSPLVVEITDLAIYNSDLKLKLIEQNLSASITYSSSSKIIDHILKTNFYCKNGLLASADQTYLDQLNGLIKLHLPLKDLSQIIILPELNFKIPKINPQDCYFITGQWQTQQGRFLASSLLDQIKINPIDLLMTPDGLKLECSGACNLSPDWRLNYWQFKFGYAHGLWQGRLSLAPSVTANPTLECEAHWHQAMQNGQIEIKHAEESCLPIKIDFNTNLQNAALNMVGTIFDLELINSWLPTNLQGLITGHGELIVDSQINAQGLTCHIKLVDGNLILPSIYNVIKNLVATFQFDFQKQALALDHILINLHKGTISLKAGMVNHKSIYLPITFNHVATNFERNLFTTCSGQILYTKQEKQIGSIKGFAGFQNTLCKYNLFDQALTKKFTSHDYKNKNMHDLSLNLNLITLTPIKMRSPSLETNAHANLKIMGSISNPQMIGQVNLIGGKLHFPAKPLQIAHGKIYFTAEQPDAPLIDLVAKNKIKNYAVTMHVNGSINNPYIILESSPTLNEEQIGTLLLLGTDNTSLNMMMPALIMQNINQTVFGAIADENQTNSLIKKLLKPLDRIKFVPSFSDETGRGGLKGAVEIEVSERLHALIQKNFSLTEDTKLEIDYAISDDASLRLIKDERGDLGSEIEIRFKI